MYMKMAQEIPGKDLYYLNSIVKLSDLSAIPFDESNKDYREYLEWVDEGNQPIEFDISILNPE